MLESVRVEPTIDPLSVETVVREVTAKDLSTKDEAALADLAPFLTTWGSPPGFDEPYAQLPPAGSFEPVEGVQIARTCSRDLTEDGAGYQSLLVTLKVGPEGADIPQLDVDYLADGKPMSLRLGWRLVACGAAITEKDFCS